ncbi:MAG: CDP-diacylglycerol--glycerol-3-phosphate 3-phosphatidyltransferase [Candidatus Izimaplasma sp.]|nr:CDP-diacylglycerol--glycerol-3-phosphate 3-phosphatidyltransferase [Candidatus Izimaplasma bacterium]
MNLPNKLSLFRVIIIPILILYYYLEVNYIRQGGSAIIYALFLAPLFIIASLTDFLDGYLARKHDLVTTFGKFIDPLADKLLVVTALLILMNPHQISTLPIIPMWIVATILAREFIVTGIRLVAVGDGNVIAASKLGKYKTASTMIAIILLLLKPYLFQTVFVDGVMKAGLIILYIATLLTVISGIDYFIKNKSALLKSV